MFRLRVLGIPVTVDSWFLVSMAFFYVLAGGGRAGLFAAAGIGVFTLIHELGHAVTARHYGCTVDIHLHFLLGWAAFSSPRPLTRAQRIAISLAGPLAGLVPGLATLAVVHALIPPGTTRRADLLLIDLWRGVSWAAIVISLLNLLPLWPLDGGHVAQKLLEIPLGERRSLRAVAMGSLVCSAVLVVVGFAGQGASGPLAAWRESAYDSLRYGWERSLPSALWSSIAALPGVLLQGLIFLPLISGMASLQLLRQLRGGDAQPWIDADQALASARPGARYDGLAMKAEREGWRTGVPTRFPRGWIPSPWLVAWCHQRGGDEPGARLALGAIVSPHGRWIPPEPRQPELRSLVALLPDPPPMGEHTRSLDLLTVLGVHGPAITVIRYATALYAHEPDAEVLYRAAAGLVQAGEPDAALDWLRRAVQDRPDADRLVNDPLLASLHGRLDFQQLVLETRQWAGLRTP